MSNDKKKTKSVHSDINLKKFLNSLEKAQRNNLGQLVAASSPNSLRKTVYLSGGGKYYKYADFILEFTYKRGYVPIHPIQTLNYYVSTLSHSFQKTEIVKDCFSLMLDCDELWVFEEKLPHYNESSSISGEKAISSFPEGVLAEIYFWLSYKPNSPIRFYTWKDAGVPKYDPENDWSIVPTELERNSEESLAPSRFGIVDLGSSTVKLTICNVDSNKQTEVMHKKAITVNLAEGFFESETLQSLPIERTIQAIIDLKEEALSYGVLDIKLIATGVVRTATNLKDFSIKVKNDTGLEIKVLSGQDEAKLIYEAVHKSFEDKNLDIVVVNAGGGSTEIVFGGGSFESIKQYSLPIGISNLNEKFMSSYPITEENYQTMKKEIISIVNKNVDNDVKDCVMVYTGGELDYMLITGFPLADFRGSLAHPKKLSLEQFKKYASKMREMTQQELQSFMPANPNWMNGAIASNTLLETIAEAFGIETIIPSNKNLNDGILINIKK